MSTSEAGPGLDYHLGHTPRTPIHTAVIMMLAIAALLAVTIGGYVVLRPRTLAVEAAPRAGDPACERVAAQWPVHVAGQPRAAMEGAAVGSAAWGDPPVVARCGLDPLPPTENDCIAAEGVDWVARNRSQSEGGMIFVTYGRSPAIEIAVPAAYAPEPLVLAAFAEAARQIEQGPNRCR